MISAIRLTGEQIGMITLCGMALLLCFPSGAFKFLFERFLNIFHFRSKLRTQSFIEIAGVRITDDDRMRHTHIVGATGSGKTVLIEHLLFRDLARGYGAIIIDPKGERAFYERVKVYCESIGRSSDLKYLSATYEEESYRWNPCRLGNESELQSKFFGSSKYEHSFYSKACELALLQAFNQIGKTKCLTLKDLEGELERLSNYGKDENLSGLFFDIKNLAEGEWAGIVGTRGKQGRQKEISLLDITRKNEILFLDLPTEGKLVQSSRLGALILQEISVLSGMRKRNPSIKSDRPFSVYVDEFDAFATEPFISFLNKGRSSDFMIHLAHQTLSDLKKVSPTFEGQVMGNTNIRFIFRVDLPEDAERLSKFFGTKSTVKHTSQTEGGSTTGRGSARDVQEFEVHPDTIKSLQTGQCVIGVKTTNTLKTVKLPMISPKSVPYPIQPVSRMPLTTDGQSTPDSTPSPFDLLSNLLKTPNPKGKIS